MDQVQEAAKELEQIVEQMKSAQTQDELTELMAKLTDEDIGSVLESEESPQEVSQAESSEEPPQAESAEAQQQSEEPQQEELTAQVEEQEEPEPETPTESLSPADKIKQDPILRQLSAMTEEERAQWAVQNGTAAMLKLMELQRLEMEQKLYEIQRQQVKPVLDQILADWIAENEEILSDPLIQDVALGLDQVLMSKKGKSSYTDFTPAEFKQHLNDILSAIKKLRGISEPQAQEQKPETKSQRTTPSLSDLGGGTPPQTSPADLLQKVANDSFKLEELVKKLPQSELDNLLAQLE